MAERRDNVGSEQLPQPWEAGRGPLSEKGWAIHRDYLMSNEVPGSRPVEYFMYDLGIEPPDNPTWYLWRNELLEPAEKSIVEGWWRSDFNRAVEGETRHLRFPTIEGKNRDKRENGNGWNEILPELITQWNAEHARTAKTVRDIIDGQAPPEEA